MIIAPLNDCTSDTASLNSNNTNTADSRTPDTTSVRRGNTLNSCTPCNEYVPECEYIGEYDLQYAEDGKVYKIRVGDEDEDLLTVFAKAMRVHVLVGTPRKWSALTLATTTLHAKSC